MTDTPGVHTTLLRLRVRPCTSTRRAGAKSVGVA
jgi:hypothetical protein